ncbi:MAG: diphthine--ammonia ligase [Candidatus Methanosuratincola sp.]
MIERVLLSWSGGKDSALSLYELLRGGGYEIVALLTTVTQGYNRVSMHGVRWELVAAQADSVGYPIERVMIPQNASNAEYESCMEEVLSRYPGVTGVVFGDIFLEEIRRYREQNLAKLGMKGIFPLWNRDSLELAETFINTGFRAIIACIDSFKLCGDFVGSLFDRNFLSSLPHQVDPCGENGEFHSFVFDGPIFRHRIEYALGRVVTRDCRFYYRDIIPLFDWSDKRA